MKHGGSVSQTYIERDRKVLPGLIRRAKHLAKYPTTSWEIVRIAVQLPTEKFYISDDAAYEYIRKRVCANIPIRFNNQYKQKLYEAFYEEVMKMKRDERYSNMRLKDITILALARPAPCVGLAPWGLWKAMRKVKNKKTAE